MSECVGVSGVGTRNNQYCRLWFESRGASSVLHTCGWSCAAPSPSHLAPCTPLALENWVKQHAAERPYRKRGFWGPQNCASTMNAGQRCDWVLIVFHIGDASLCAANAHYQRAMWLTSWTFFMRRNKEE